MNRFLVHWIEQYLFFPTLLQQLIGFLLLPFTLLYCIVITFKRLSKKPQYFGIPVVSIGNLLVGGTGKTPVTIALAKDKEDIAIVLRGYGRASKGLFVISLKGKILEDVTTSGDEAMLLAKALPKATIIVSEDRILAIKKAKKLQCKVVFLDDGYGKHEILKYDILVRPKDEPTNIFCLPSGGYRDSKMMYSFANCVIKEDKDFIRKVSFKDSQNNPISKLPPKILLLTAISKPNRLLEYLPKNIIMVSFPDHYNFTQNDIDKIQEKYPNFEIVTTAKDMVKLKQLAFTTNIYLMDLEITLSKEIIQKVDTYINSFK
ncbi:MAG: tetraacyldisaccharide 4'-kinase [Arcobacter sp.]|nr:MAG: tetraacyldisaccharide 4'-kinase [Arcobacter sp.]